MRDEPGIERDLRRVRAAGPPAELRSRILSRAYERRGWPWMAAAAALLCVSLGLRGALDRHAATVIDTVDAPPLEARVDRMTHLLGPGDESRRLAIFIVTADEVARQARAIEEER